MGTLGPVQSVTKAHRQRRELWKNQVARLDGLAVDCLHTDRASRNRAQAKVPRECLRDGKLKEAILNIVAAVLIDLPSGSCISESADDEVNAVLGGLFKSWLSGRQSTIKRSCPDFLATENSPTEALQHLL